MAIILKNSWNIPPVRWGSFTDIQYAIKVNAEKIYSIDSDSIVLATPLFWGIYTDFSTHKNIITNYGAIRNKEGGFYFSGSTYMIVSQDPSLEFGTGDFSLSYKFKTGSANPLVILSYGDRFDSAGWTSYIGANGVAKIIIDDSTNQVITEDAINHADNIKHNYVTSIDKNNDQTVFLDGQNVASNNIGAVGNLSTNDHDSIQIGRAWYKDIYVYYFTGTLYDLLINNIALTENQAKLFNSIPYGLYQKVARPFYLLPIVATTAPPTTIAPTSLAPTTLAPTSLPPTTTPVATTPPPTTAAPTTAYPTSAVPTTPGPTSVTPTTLFQTTAGPTTKAPTSLAPTTSVPTTIAPTSLPPTTLAPTTPVPTSAAPTTLAPTTIAPSTAVPTTAAPTTLAPTSLAPTTILLTTLAPTTNIPELICVKEIESTITNEFITKSFIANQLLLESYITKELRIHGNLC